MWRDIKFFSGQQQLKNNVIPCWDLDCAFLFARASKLCECFSLLKRMCRGQHVSCTLCILAAAGTWWMCIRIDLVLLQLENIAFRNEACLRKHQPLVCLHYTNGYHWLYIHGVSFNTRSWRHVHTNTRKPLGIKAPLLAVLGFQIWFEALCGFEFPPLLLVFLFLYDLVCVRVCTCVCGRRKGHRSFGSSVSQVCLAHSLLLTGTNPVCNSGPVRYWHMDMSQ